MKITIIKDKPISMVEIGRKTLTKVKCIVLLGKCTLNRNVSFIGLNFNNFKFSLN